MCKLDSDQAADRPNVAQFVCLEWSYFVGQETGFVFYRKELRWQKSLGDFEIHGKPNNPYYSLLWYYERKRRRGQRRIWLIDMK